MGPYSPPLRTAMSPLGILSGLHGAQQVCRFNPTSINILHGSRESKFINSMPSRIVLHGLHRAPVGSQMEPRVYGPTHNPRYSGDATCRERWNLGSFGHAGQQDVTKLYTLLIALVIVHELMATLGTNDSSIEKGNPCCKHMPHCMCLGLKRIVAPQDLFVKRLLLIVSFFATFRAGWETQS